MELETLQSRYCYLVRNTFCNLSEADCLCHAMPTFEQHYKQRVWASLLDFGLMAIPHMLVLKRKP